MLSRRSRSSSGPSTSIIHTKPGTMEVHDAAHHGRLSSPFQFSWPGGAKFPTNAFALAWHSLSVFERAEFALISFVGFVPSNTVCPETVPFSGTSSLESHPGVCFYSNLQVVSRGKGNPNRGFLGAFNPQSGAAVRCWTIFPGVGLSLAAWSVFLRYAPGSAQHVRLCRWADLLTSI